MAFVDGQEYTGTNGKTGTWNAQTGTFHVLSDGERQKFTAAEFGLEDTVVVQETVTTVEE